MKIVAHRGASLEAPENTHAAINLAWDVGADGCEIDVQLTSDERVVVIHDETLARTAVRVDRVRDVSWEDVRLLNAGSWKGPAFASERIPLLGDVLEFLPPGKQLFIEVKCGSEIVDPMKGVLRPHAARRDDIIFLGFNPRVMADVKQAFPAHKVLLNVEPPETKSAISTTIMDSFAANLLEERLDGISFGYSPMITPRLLKHVASKGLATALWVIDEPLVAADYKSAGLDVLMTNDPRRLCAALQ